MSQVGQKKRGRKETEKANFSEAAKKSKVENEIAEPSKKQKTYSVEMTLFLCLKRYKNGIPPEIGELIFSYLYKRIDNGNIREAVAEMLMMKRPAALIKYGCISYWETSRVTDMSKLFMGNYQFNEDISGWDVSNVTTMESMFQNVGMYNQPLECWNVSKVTNMANMFHNAMAFNQPLGKWDVSHVTTMECMFCYAAQFNQPLDSWDIGEVRDMSQMFFHAKAYKQPLNGWKVRKGMKMRDMFKGAMRMTAAMRVTAA